MRNLLTQWLIGLLTLVAVSLTTVRCHATNSAKANAAAPAASAKSVKRKAIVKISEQIDSLVLAKLDEEGIKQNPKASDEVFLRRIYLDVIGRIPTLEETKAFLNSKSKAKRADLIDELLDSYGFVSHQFNFYADLLRVQTRSNKVIGQPYIDFIKDSLEDNMPYDQFVVELLSAEGKMLSPESSAVGYYLRDLNMPEDNMSNTVRVFLGTRLECAQCHDHPYDKWTQRDYFEMVAFTGGIDYGGGNILKMLSKDERQKFESMKEEIGDGYFRMRRLLSTSQMGVFGSGTGLARLPEGFMGSDGEENEIIIGKTMFEKEALVDSTVPTQSPSKSKRKRKRKNQRGQKNIRGAKDIGSRKAYALWLTSEENPRFATTIANRLWKQAFGLALIEPVDVIEDHSEASNEDLMAYLTETMIELKFDRKQFLRAIYNSRSYQSVATASDISDPLTHAFNGPIVRRMSAEQIWDSLLTLTVPNIDRRATQPVNSRLGEINEVVTALSNNDEGALDQLIEFAKSNPKKSMMVGNTKRAAKKAGREMKQTLKSLNKAIQVARRSHNESEVRALMLERAEKIQSLKSGISRNYSRASEIDSPAPAAHFLRKFGQSDRDQIENSNRDPAVPQVLSMMNGMIEKQIVKDPNTVLMSNLLKMSGASENKQDASQTDAMDTIFLTMLNREPTPSEKRLWQTDLGTDFASGYGDLIWTLANSNEFIFLK